MRKVMIILSVLIIAVGFKAVYADDGATYFSKISFEKIGRDQGLQNLSISSIVQDRNGFVWFGSQGGLYRYDGRDTLAYRNNPFDSDGLIHNLIQTMYYDSSKHQLWLGTYQGVSLLDIETNTFINYSVEVNNLSNNVVVAIAQDRMGQMWFGTLDGLNRLDETTGTFVNYAIEESVVRSILLDSTGRLLIGTYDGLYYYDEPSDQVKRVDIPYPTNFVMVVKEFVPGIITLGLWDGGVLELDHEFNRLSHRLYDDNRVYAVEKTDDDTLWVGTWGGGLFSDTGSETYSFETSTSVNRIDHPIVYSLMEDSTGILWVGTNGGGVFKTNPGKRNYLEYYHDAQNEDSLDEGKINKLYRDSKDRLWIAVYNKGLNRILSQTDQVIKYNAENEKLQNNQIMDFLEHNGTLLIASGVGVDYYDESQNRFVASTLLPDETITYALAEDMEKHLWVGTYLDGVYEFDENNKQVNHIHVKSEPLTLSDNLVYDIIADQSGRIWIGTNNGLNVYDKQTREIKAYFKEDGNLNKLPNNTVRTLLVTENGTLWIGMVGGGISKYMSETDSFITYTEENGLADNTVIGLEEAEDGKIWIATHNGISVLDPETEHIINLTLADGIGGYTFTGDGFRDFDNSLYFVGTHGVTRFPAQTEITGTSLPPVYITDFKVMEEPVSKNISIFNNQKYAFDSNENFVSFGFNAIDYEYLSHVQYSYRMVGVDEQWIESGSRNYVSYSNLESGDYAFEVRAKTIQGIYTEPISVEFQIARAWYNTNIAYLFYTFIAGFVIYSIIKIRENRLIGQKNTELSHLNNRLEDAVKELEAVSIKDGLTGIFNRRYFNTVISEHFMMAKRSKLPISLLMIDVDDFKEINDAYGHVFGDKFLIEFAKRITESLLRGTDFCSRFGGDEFAVVLYDTDLQGAIDVSETIRQGVSKLTIDHNGTQVLIDTKLCIGGYSIVPENQMNLETFITIADEALYNAKKSGKDQTIIK